MTTGGGQGGFPGSPRLFLNPALLSPFESSTVDLNISRVPSLPRASKTRARTARDIPISPVSIQTRPVLTMTASPSTWWRIARRPGWGTAGAIRKTITRFAVSVELFFHTNRQTGSFFVTRKRFQVLRPHTPVSGKCLAELVLACLAPLSPSLALSLSLFLSFTRSSRHPLRPPRSRVLVAPTPFTCERWNNPSHAFCIHCMLNNCQRIFSFSLVSPSTASVANL